MKPSPALFIAISIYSSLTFAEPGFFNITVDKVPAAVRRAAQSVFMIAVPAGELVSVKDLFHGHSVEESISHIEQMPLQENLHQPDKDVFLYQLRQCQTKNDSVCKIFEGVAMGSGFVIGDGQTIRTAFHEIKDFALSTAKTQLPVFVYNSKGDLIASPSTGFAAATFAPRNVISPQFPGQIKLSNDDVAELKFGATLGTPIVQSAAQVQAGSSIFIVGYPHKTEDRKNFNAPDSPGYSLKVSLGHALTIDEMYRKLGKDPAQVPDPVKEYFRHGVIASNADGAPGLSGGVTLNSNGEIVGTYTAGNPIGGEASPDPLSYSSNDFFFEK